MIRTCLLVFENSLIVDYSGTIEIIITKVSLQQQINFHSAESSGGSSRVTP